jgi:hypothetical protein
MSLQRMPNGDYVDIPDNAAPEVVARIKSQYPLKAKSSTIRKPATEVEKRASFYRQYENATGGTANRLIAKGVLSNFDDELGGAIAAGTRGVYRAIKNRDFGEISKEYRTEKAAQQLVHKQYADEHPVISTIGELGGSLLSPIGKGVGALKVAAKGANLLRAEKIAAALGKGADRISKVGPIGSSVLAGINQGAVSAAGASDGNILGDATNGALIGGAAGGVLGGIGTLGMKAVRAIRTGSKSTSGNEAYERIANLLDSSGTTPSRAAMELNLANREGGDAMLMDLSPQLRQQAGYLKRDPNLKEATNLENRGMARIEQRGGRFEDKVRGITENPKDALKRIDEIEEARKTVGTKDYVEGGVLDKPFVWNDKLENQFATATPSLKAGLSSAVTRIKDARMNTDSLGIKFDAAGDVTYMKIPSMRVFDEVKRGFDERIGTALSAGNKGEAQRISKELGMLKDNIMESNPDYAAVLATQRDLFQKQDAVEKGQVALKRLTKEPRVLLKELRALEPENLQEHRIGFIDTLMNLNDGARNPITVFKNAMATPRQRAVLELMFEGKGKLGKLDRYIKREQRAAQADARTSASGQSISSEIAMAAELGTTTGRAKLVFARALSGIGFGGLLGGLGNTARTINLIQGKLGAEAQNEIARILMSSDGIKLKAGVSAARKAAKVRSEKNKLIGESIGKVSGNLFGTRVGGQ